MIKITIQEVANDFSLSKDTLRYYEKEGLIDPVKKNKSGIREYTAEDLKHIEFIKCMHSAGLSISVLKEYIKLYNEGEQTRDLRINLLERERISLKSKIEDMEKAYEKLEYKIKLYKENKM